MKQKEKKIIECGMGVSIAPTIEEENGLKYKSYSMKNKEVADDE